MITQIHIEVTERCRLRTTLYELQCRATLVSPSMHHLKGSKYYMWLPPATIAEHWARFYLKGGCRLPYTGLHTG